MQRECARVVTFTVNFMHLRLRTSFVLGWWNTISGQDSFSNIVVMHTFNFVLGPVRPLTRR